MSSTITNRGSLITREEDLTHNGVLIQRGGILHDSFRVDTEAGSDLNDAKGHSLATRSHFPTAPILQS